MKTEKWDSDLEPFDTRIPQARLSPALRRKLAEVAKQEMMSEADIIRIALSEYLKEKTS